MITIAFAVARASFIDHIFMQSSPRFSNRFRTRPPLFGLGALLAALALTFALNATAQKTPPPNLEPLPEAPPPAPEIAADPDLEPQITVVRRPNETVEEYRVGGRLTMIKVTPKSGRPYYLVADDADGTWIRRDSLDPGTRVPMWLLFSF